MRSMIDDGLAAWTGFQMLGLKLWSIILAYSHRCISTKKTTRKLPGEPVHRSLNGCTVVIYGPSKSMFMHIGQSINKQIDIYVYRHWTASKRYPDVYRRKEQKHTNETHRVDWTPHVSFRFFFCSSLFHVAVDGALGRAHGYNLPVKDVAAATIIIVYGCGAKKRRETQLSTKQCKQIAEKFTEGRYTAAAKGFVGSFSLHRIKMCASVCFYVSVYQPVSAIRKMWFNAK